MKNFTLKEHFAHFRILTYGGVTFAIIGLMCKPSGNWMVWAGLVVELAGLVYRSVFIKCPHCGDKLATTKTLPRRCPNCGKTLQQE